MPSSRSSRSDLLLLLTVLVWGLNFPIIKVALGVMPPFVVNVLRFAVSATVLGGLYAWQIRGQRGAFWAPLREHGWTVLGLGLLGYVGYQLLFIVGVDATSAGSAALIIASSPVWTAIIARLLGMEYIPPAAWAGLLISLGGTALVVLGDHGADGFTQDTPFGNLLMLGAALAWAAYTALSRPVLAKGVSATGLAFFGIVIALPFLWGLGLPAFGEVDWEEVTAKVWLAVLFSGGLSTGVAYAWWNAAVRRIGPSQASIYSNLVPVVALVSSVLILGETVTLYQIGGGALILTGLMLMRRARRPVPA